LIQDKFSQLFTDFGHLAVEFSTQLSAANRMRTLSSVEVSDLKEQIVATPPTIAMSQDRLRQFATDFGHFAREVSTLLWQNTNCEGSG
jgi:hypothetical protein